MIRIPVNEGSSVITLGDQMRYKILYIAILLFCIAILTVCTASALETVEVTDDVHSQHGVDTTDRYIVWEDERHTSTEIYAYDIFAQKQIRVSDDQMRSRSPKISNDKVIWRNDWSSMWVSNLSTESRWEFYYDPNDVEAHDLSGNMAAIVNSSWMGGGGYDVNLKVYDFGTASMRHIWSMTGSDLYVEDVDLKGHMALVVLDTDTGGKIININTNTHNAVPFDVPSWTKKCLYSGPGTSTAICSANFGIFKIDLTTGSITDFEITVFGFDEINFDIHKDRMIFVNITPEGFQFDVYLYDLNTKILQRLTYDPDWDAFIALHKDTVALTKARGGSIDVFYMKIPENPPDLAVSDSGIVSHPSFPIENERAEISVKVQNRGRSPCSASVILHVPDLGSQGKDEYIITTDEIPIGGTRGVHFEEVFFGPRGERDIHVEVMAVEGEEEINKENNDAYKTIFVNDLPLPVIEPPEENVIETGEALNFSGHPSTDRDGIMVYTWDFGDGSSVLGPEAMHSWSDDGTYSVILTVYDIYGATNSTDVQVNVTNRPPVASWDVPEVVARNTNVLFSAVGSVDPDGSIEEVRWEIGDGSNVTYGMVSSYSFTTLDQVMNVTLVLVDDDGATTEVEMEVTLVESTAENIPPIAVINVNGNGGNLTLSGSGSYDPNGEIVSFEWSFGDGSTSEGESVNHYFDEGNHFVTLTVKDDEDLTGSAVVAVNINYTAPPTIRKEVYGNTTVVNQVLGNEAPTASASFEVVDETTGEVDFHGTGSDPDGNITDYAWDFDGDGTYDHTSTTSGNVMHTYDKPGYYLAIFRVTDDNGTSAVTVVSVSIRTNELGGNNTVMKDTEAEGALDPMIVIILIVVGIAVAATVAVATSKKFSKVEIDEASQHELQELQRLVDESKTTGAQVEEAEALIRQLENQ